MEDSNIEEEGGEREGSSEKGDEEGGREGGTLDDHTLTLVQDTRFSGTNGRTCTSAASSTPASP